jgi:hypothetical protein
MSNYTESKKKLDTIRRKYNCKGDIIFKTAIQNVIDYGKFTILDPSWYQCMLNDVNTNHDLAEKEGKILFMTRNFEIAILECMKELAEISAYDLMIYIQRELYLGGGEVGEPDYQRAMEIIRNCLCYMADCYGSYSLDKEETLNKFLQIDLSDEEIIYFGWEELLEEEEEDY